MPFLLKELKLEVHAVLHLHRTTFRISAAWLVMTSCSPSSVSLHPHSVGSSSLASSILQCSACSLLARYDIAQKLLLVATSMVILAEQLIPKFIQCLNHRSSSYQRQKPSQAASIISSDDPQMSIEMVNARGIDRMAVLGLDACTIVWQNAVCFEHDDTSSFINIYSRPGTHWPLLAVLPDMSSDVRYWSAHNFKSHTANAIRLSAVRTIRILSSAGSACRSAYHLSLIRYEHISWKQITSRHPDTSLNTVWVRTILLQ